MLTSNDILSTLDNCDKYSSFNFITLEHPYIHLVDSRINVFRNNSAEWAIVSEVLGCNNRGYSIPLEIRYFGNCLFNLETDYNNKTYNHYNVFPIGNASIEKTIDDVTQALKRKAKSWIVRGQMILLSHNKQDYANAGINLKEYEPDEIAGEEAARLVVQKHRNLFRATDEELYKSIPQSLDKILVIDEWFHKEFHQSKSPFENSETLSKFDITNEQVRNMMDDEIDKSKNWNAKQWRNRPSSYETWQQIADVIVTGNTSFYQPTLKPNSHWENWPEGGSM